MPVGGYAAIEAARKKAKASKNTTGSGGAWGADGKVVAPSTAPKATVSKVTKTSAPGKNSSRDALIAAYITKLQGKMGAQTPKSIGDMSGQIPGVPDFSQYTGPTVPDYGSDVNDSQFGAFKQGATTSIDPKTYARVAGSAYTPLLDTLKQQQQGYQNGIATGNSQIDSAYGAASDLATQARDKILGAGASAVSAGNDFAKNLVGSTGSDPKGSLAASQANSIQGGYSSALAGVDAQGAADSGAAAQRQAALAKLDYTNAATAKSNDAGTAAGQLGITQSQDSQKALMDALSFNDTMKTAGLNRDVTAQSAKLASSLAGGEITAQALANAGARAGLSSEAIKSMQDKLTLNNGVKQDNFNNMVSKVNTVAQLKTLAAAGKTAGLDVATLPKASAAMVDDTVYGNIRAQLIDPVIGADDVSVTDPRKLYDKTFASLNQIDSKTPKPVRAALARRLVQGTLDKFNSKNASDKNGAWYWDGNTFSQRKPIKSS